MLSAPLTIERASEASQRAPTMCSERVRRPRDWRAKQDGAQLDGRPVRVCRRESKLSRAMEFERNLETLAIGAATQSCAPPPQAVASLASNSQDKRPALAKVEESGQRLATRLVSRPSGGLRCGAPTACTEGRRRRLLLLVFALALQQLICDTMQTGLRSGPSIVAQAKGK